MRNSVSKELRVIGIGISPWSLVLFKDKYKFVVLGPSLGLEPS